MAKNGGLQARRVFRVEFRAGTVRLGLETGRSTAFVAGVSRDGIASP
jgi:hypothetical protein